MKNNQILAFFQVAPPVATRILCAVILLSMFVKIIYFLFFVSLGIAILKYRKNVYEWTGQWYWAEKWL